MRAIFAGSELPAHDDIHLLGGTHAFVAVVALSAKVMLAEQLASSLAERAVLQEGLSAHVAKQ
jgi:hypothetical protein